ncbi:MAG: hypothetical protein IMZ55_09930 [Acidobacteria bacterium]|nr:hypothetical protein [Acidobacteriota bacterium]MBE3133783.1 hypothetical protein [Acidobacteriota bacterium]
MAKAKKTTAVPRVDPLYLLEDEPVPGFEVDELPQPDGPASDVIARPEGAVGGQNAVLAHPENSNGKGDQS